MHTFERTDVIQHNSHSLQVNKRVCQGVSVFTIAIGNTHTHPDKGKLNGSFYVGAQSTHTHSLCRVQYRLYEERTHTAALALAGPEAAIVNLAFVYCGKTHQTQTPEHMKATSQQRAENRSEYLPLLSTSVNLPLTGEGERLRDSHRWGRRERKHEKHGEDRQREAAE